MRHRLGEKAKFLLMVRQRLYQTLGVKGEVVDAACASIGLIQRPPLYFVCTGSSTHTWSSSRQTTPPAL